ncbi:MAG: hypothetical protein U0350_21900 [Caldilineaceae bacterium]
MYLVMNAWRELLARVFDGFNEQDNVSPDWLVNPATKRRLKLDKYYPDAGVAIRFIGLTAKGQGRQSDWEVLETEQRDQTRAELCRANGVQLVTIDPNDEPLKQLDSLLNILARASRLLAQSDHPASHKQQWMPALSAARERGAKLRTVLSKNPEQMMATWAESWRDRESGLFSAPVPLSQPVKKSHAKPGKAPAYQAGQRVRHERYGDGVITNVVANNGDTTISILFDAAQERAFLAALVQDKLTLL